MTRKPTPPAPAPSPAARAALQIEDLRQQLLRGLSLLYIVHRALEDTGAAAEIADALDIGISHINRTCEDMDNAATRLKEQAG